MCRLDSVLYKHLEHAMKHFFGWQALGFLVAAIVVATQPAGGCEPRARRLPRALHLGVAGVFPGRRDGRKAGTAVALDRLRGERNAARDPMGGRRAIRNLGRRGGRRLCRARAGLLLLGRPPRDHPGERGRAGRCHRLPGAALSAAAIDGLDRRFPLSRSARGTRVSHDRVVHAGSDLGDPGGRVHRRQHERTSFPTPCACISRTCSA